MRFEKENCFIEIEDGMSPSGEAWDVKTNVDKFPPEFAASVPKADKEGVERLKKDISSWASKNQFERVQVPGKIDYA